MAKQTIKQRVADAAEELRGMDHGELFAWTREHGMDSRSGFANFKKALLEIGVDYNALRAGKAADRREALEAAATHSVTLYTDAKARTDRFAIYDAEGEPVWFGRFFDSDRDYNGEQSSGEMSAAKKAVWFASKIAEAIGEKAIRLNLIVDAEWLTYANDAVNHPHGKRGGKARDLAEAARRCNVVLHVEHVPGVENPADKFTVASGYKKWQENDLAMLTDDRAADREAKRREAEAAAEAERLEAARQREERQRQADREAAQREEDRRAAQAPQRPLTDEERQALEAADLDALRPLKRKKRKALLYEANLPNHAAALDEIARRLEVTEVTA